MLVILLSQLIQIIKSHPANMRVTSLDNCKIDTITCNTSLPQLKFSPQDLPLTSQNPSDSNS